MKMTRVVIFFVLATVGLLAQTSDPAIQTPASREDVQKATNAVTTKLMRALRDAEKKALERSKQEQEKREMEKAAEAERIEKKLAAEAAAKKESEKAQTTALSLGLTTLLFLLIGIVYIWRKKPEAKHHSAFEAVVPVETKPNLVLVNPQQSEVLRDPDIAALRAFSLRNNGITTIPFTLPLNEGVLNCTAYLEGKNVFVGFGDNTRSAWDKRRQAGAKVLAGRIAS